MNPKPNPPSPSPTHAALEAFLRSVHVGMPRTHARMTVFPLHLPGDLGPDYVALDEAMAAGAFRVTEVSEAGSVSNLHVSNALGRAVVLIDGEELVGAKQNRAVNLSLLLPAGFRGTIPVSCTEHHRWHATSAEFKPSHTVIDRETRRRKSEAVSESLRDEASFTSNKSQQEVWKAISELQMKAQYLSATSSSHEVFVARERELAVALSTFAPTEGQHGLMVFLDGAFVGLDLVSRSNAFARLHPKLIRSYAMDAVLGQRHPASRVEMVSAPARETAEGILHRAAGRPAHVHPSVGAGETVRCEGQDLFGTALVAEGVAVHAAFFGATPATHRSPEESRLLARRRHARGPQP